MGVEDSEVRRACRPTSRYLRCCKTRQHEIWRQCSTGLAMARKLEKDSDMVNAEIIDKKEYATGTEHKEVV